MSCAPIDAYTYNNSYFIYCQQPDGITQVQAINIIMLLLPQWQIFSERLAALQGLIGAVV